MLVPPRRTSQAPATRQLPTYPLVRRSWRAVAVILERAPSNLPVVSPREPVRFGPLPVSARAFSATALAALERWHAAAPRDRARTRRCWGRRVHPRMRRRPRRAPAPPRSIQALQYYPISGRRHQKKPKWPRRVAPNCWPHACCWASSWRRPQVRPVACRPVRRFASHHSTKRFREQRAQQLQPLAGVSRRGCAH